VQSTIGTFSLRPNANITRAPSILGFDIVVIFFATTFHWFGLTYTLVYAAEVLQGSRYAGCPDTSANRATFKGAASEDDFLKPAADACRLDGPEANIS